MTTPTHPTARPRAALSLFCLLLPACQGPGADVAAVVDGYQITLADLDRYYLSQLGEQAGPPARTKSA